MPQSLDGLVWLLVLLGPLLLLQRWLHREIQILLLVIVRRAELVPVIFSIFFFPGVALHELSHFLMAMILQVPTGKFSLIPQAMPDGRLQLGYVETAKTDLVRDALIGAAPFFAGSAFVAYGGLALLHLDRLWSAIISGSSDILWSATNQIYSVQDFWLWFYLVFTVSSTMLPSRSDRRAWLPLALGVVILVTVTLLIGAGSWMLENVAPFVNKVFQASAVVIAISSGVHIVLLAPIWLARTVLMKIFGLHIGS